MSERQYNSEFLFYKWRKLLKETEIQGGELSYNSTNICSVPTMNRIWGQFAQDRHTFSKGDKTNILIIKIIGGQL